MSQRGASVGSGSVDPGLQEVYHILQTVSPQQMKILSALSSVAIIFLGWFSIIVEVFLRHDFGQRYQGLRP